VSSLKRPGVIAAAMLAAILGIPLTRLWWSEHGKHPYERLERERREERAAMEALVPQARADLGCDDAEVAARGLEIWASGCGKRARYVLQGGAWRREGEVVPDDTRADPSGCAARWRRGDEGSAKDAAAAALAAKKVARVRVPVSAMGFEGFAKLRFGDFVEASFDAPPLDAPVVPCARDGGGEAQCAAPWRTVVEVDECG
jgi:hypothetical protein